MPEQTHGYSGKPLYEKLGLKPGMTCLPIRPPPEYPEFVRGALGVRFIKRAAPSECVHVFCRRKRHVPPLFSRALRSVTEGGMIWMSWPKKSSDMFIDLTEQDFRDHILPLGWVDVKVCAVNADWSGLKFVRRKS